MLPEISLRNTTQQFRRKRECRRWPCPKLACSLRYSRVEGAVMRTALCNSLTHSLAPSLPPSPRSLAHSLTHPPTHSLTHSLTPSLHSLSHSLACIRESPSVHNMQAKNGLKAAEPSRARFKRDQSIKRPGASSTSVPEVERLATPRMVEGQGLRNALSQSLSPAELSACRAD